MGTIRYIQFIALILLTSPSYAGFLGGGVAFNSSKSFNTQTDGLRLDFGSHINTAVDLEFNLVDFGVSSYNDPSYLNAETTSTDDFGAFKNEGFGDVSKNEGGLTYSGIEETHSYGVGAGIKIRKDVNNWLQAYARLSFLAWESTAQNFKLHGVRKPIDENGDTVLAINAKNLNPCGTLTLCREATEETKHQAMDFWYGYGLIIKPFSWLALRAEYSITTLNAVDFPRSTLEGVTASLEIHY